MFKKFDKTDLITLNLFKYWYNSFLDFLEIVHKLVKILKYMWNVQIVWQNFLNLIWIRPKIVNIP